VCTNWIVNYVCAVSLLNPIGEGILSGRAAISYSVLRPQIVSAVVMRAPVGIDESQRVTIVRAHRPSPGGNRPSDSELFPIHDRPAFAVIRVVHVSGAWVHQPRQIPIQFDASEPFDQASTNRVFAVMFRTANGSSKRRFHAVVRDGRHVLAVAKMLRPPPRRGL
jgi:hypothetical protein